MKRITITTCSVLTGLLILSVIMVTFRSSKAMAADSVCYQSEPANYVMKNPPKVTKVLDCGGEPNFHEIEKSVRGHDLEGDKCYIIQAGIAGITDGNLISSDVCKAAEATRIDKGTPIAADTTPITSTSADQQTLNNPDSASAEPINTDRSEIRDCDGRGDATKVKHCLDINPIVKIIQDVLVFLTAVVGIAVIGSIIMGGIQYSASHGDPNVVAKAKSRITNALIAFVAYIFLYAFLQWLIPGGPF